MIVKDFAPLTALAIVGLAGCSSTSISENGAAGALAVSEESYGLRAKAKLLGPDGERIGDASAWQGRSGVLIELSATNLPAGPHGVHIHAVGTCEDDRDYRSSGGHVGNDEGPHGLLHPNGPHRGDLPNIHVHGDGTVKVEFYSSLISLAELRDENGAALVIHEDRDDWQSQPIGRSGGRIACAAFRPTTNQ